MGIKRLSVSWMVWTLGGVLLVPLGLGSAQAQDNDGDSFDVADGDCDDNESLAFPGNVEECDGIDNDCDGLIDEQGASPVHCTTAPFLEAPFNNAAGGHMIVHVEKFVDFVDLTGTDLWLDTNQGTSVPAGQEVNVQSILVRSWMGTSSFDVAGRIDMTFPPEVTVLGWVIDFVGPDGPINRAWDSTFSPVPGGLLIPETTNTHFEAVDWAVAGVGFAQTYMFIATAADEARLLISYDPDLLVDELTFDAVMTSNLQGLYMCEDNLGTSGAFTITLADADLDLIDDDGDGVAECDGDCDDTDAANFPGNTEVCDGADNDCDGALSDAEVDDDGDGQTECDGDCDDADAANFLGNPEVCDGADNDCDGVIPADETDDDGDGQTECDGDCDDVDPANFFGNIEICDDGSDNDCDGAVDGADPDCPQGDDDDDDDDDSSGDDDDDDATDDDDDASGDDDDSTGIGGLDGGMEVPDCGCSKTSGQGAAPMGLLLLAGLLGSLRRRRLA
jgi:MYXO-CTERM domain-containing protein